MSWSIAEVARMSKVTSRTLRHYDDIGLLPPARVAPSGYRYYERDQLLRLQQILLLRDLGLSLDSIGGILAGDVDTAQALRRHLRWLREERDRLGRLIGTVEKTITSAEGGEDMPAEQLFDGVDPDQLARWEAEARQRWGQDDPAAFDASVRRVKSWSAEKQQAIAAKYAAVVARLGELFDQKVPVDDERTLDAVAAHHEWLLNFWTPNRESYTGLGQHYHDEPSFKKQFDAHHPRFAAYIRDAMAAYAEARL